ncbi:MAG: DedA family protein [Acidobacteria bacterium]|jgi:membrane protein DedA with SNARE-associated domain|nr:MAG: DedA family protein [Acidobacteriota bacterium]
MLEQVLSALTQYGSPALFVIVMIAAAGVPLPVTFLLIVTGSLASQGVINLWWAIGMASAGSVIGDQIGYAIGRWGGSALIERFGRALGGQDRLKHAEAEARRWSGPAVFFTRWLISPLGSSVNLASGIARYPWKRFLLWDLLGKILGVVIWVTLGRVFSDRVQTFNHLLVHLTWAIIAFAAAVLVGRRLVSYLRPQEFRRVAEPETAKSTTAGSAG